MNINAKFLNKIVATQTQQYTKSLLYHDEVGVFQGMQVQTNEKENTTFQNLWVTAKTVQREDIHNYIGLLQQTRKILNKQSNLAF